MSTQVLSVALPTSTLYVSGTVNGVSTTWTNTTGNTWETVADRAEDDTYHLLLTAINSSGVSTEFSLTLYYGVLNLITDRTKADVERARYLAAKGWANMTEEERAEWSAGLKGAYNVSDLNRVGAAVDYVAGRFNALGYSLEVETKQNWLVSDIPTSEQMAAYLNSVSYLRPVVSVFPTTPEVPEDMEGLTYTEANNIEQILFDLDLVVKHIIAAWYYSGELYSGEV